MGIGMGRDILSSRVERWRYRALLFTSSDDIIIAELAMEMEVGRDWEWQETSQLEEMAAASICMDSCIETQAG